MAPLHDDPRGHSLLEQALGRLTAVFQPLVRTDTLEIVAYEGLTRISLGGTELTFLDLLDLARARGRLGELELAAVRTVCRSFVEQKGTGRLLINLSAHAILQESVRPDDVLEALSSCGMDLGRITVEITERDVAEDPVQLADALGYLRARGVRMALDDFGNGHSNFQMWNEIHPEVVKLDRYLIDGLADSAEKLAIVRALCQVAETLGAHLVGEGVERAEDLRMLRELGIPYAQGFLIARPVPVLARQAHDEAHQALREQSLPVPPRHRGPVTQRPMYAGHLMIEAPAFHSGQSNLDIAAFFAGNAELHATAVVENERPVGLINRRVFNERMTQPFARELFGRRSCTLFMHREPLLCDMHQSLESMADILRGEDQRYLSDGFIITRNGRYMGLGTGESLVRRVTEMRIEAARYANPLTFLPGNIPVTEHIARLLRAERPFTAAYVDLNDFKPYNDEYGYFQGDEMIRLLAGVLTAGVDSSRDFVGHIGGDDFMLVMQSEDWQARCQHVVATFNERARALFSADDIERGGLAGEDRRGNPQFFALTTVSIGAVRVERVFPRQPEAVASLAATAKRHAKRERLGFHVVDLLEPDMLGRLAMDPA